MKSKKKRRIFDVIRIFVLLIAVSVLLYPSVSNYLYELKNRGIKNDYDSQVQQLSQEEKDDMFLAAVEYNKMLAGEEIETLENPFTKAEKEPDQLYESLLKMNDTGMMGYIKIPKINLELPIYHGTEESVLQVGVGHFEGTSLPVGGEGTHAVLTGHRGLPSKELFTNLDKLELGDIFYIKVFGETLAYQVDDIKTVLPEDTSSLVPVAGEDYVTLITCTPYAVNTHRLLVRGHRVDYSTAVLSVPDIEIEPEIPFEVKMLILAIAIIVVTFIIYRIVKSISKKRKQENNHEKEIKNK